MPNPPTQFLPPLQLPDDHSAHGLLAFLEETRVRLPLKAVECHFDVCGELAQVEISQCFHNRYPRALDCTYSFPLPAGAAVYRCEMILRGRLIAAKVMEQNEARAMAREKKAEGHRVALVEVERENLFTLTLANVQKDDVIIVRLAYFQKLERLDSEVSVRIPSCPGVRYIPGEPFLRGQPGRGTADNTRQVPDASRISPPRIDSFHPDAATLYVRGTLQEMREQIRNISSPSHAVVVKPDAAPGLDVSIALADAKAHVPDRDFVLRWEQIAPLGLTQVAWLERHGDEVFALAQISAPPLSATECALARRHTDFYFLVDRSGSMAGRKWTQAAEAFRGFLRALQPEDRAWVTFFESTYIDLGDAPMKPAELLAEPTVQDLEALGTAGGTELLPALSHVVKDVMRTHSERAERPCTVILITDGQVGNESEILSLMKDHPRVVVHALGIDDAVNDAFLRQLARQQHGQCFLRTPQDDIVGLVARLGDRLRAPIYTGLSFAAPWSPAVDAPLHLYAGETIVAALRAPRTSTARGDDFADAPPLQLTGERADGGKIDAAVKLTAAEGFEAIRLMWVQEKITACLDAHDPMGAIQLGIANNLVCRGAAWIAWDEVEKKEVATEMLYQPSQEPVMAAAYAMPMASAPPPPHQSVYPAGSRNKITGGLPGPSQIARAVRSMIALPPAPPAPPSPSDTQQIYVSAPSAPAPAPAARPGGGPRLLDPTTWFGGGSAGTGSDDPATLVAEEFGLWATGASLISSSRLTKWRNEFLAKTPLPRALADAVANVLCHWVTQGPDVASVRWSALDSQQKLWTANPPSAAELKASLKSFTKAHLTAKWAGAMEKLLAS